MAEAAQAAPTGAGGGAGAGAPAAMRIGQRVVDKKGFVGTVRYVGSVPTAKKATTIYAGIEWDDATRGKHDGSVAKDGERIQLYTCEQGRGSFLKLPLLSKGVSMVQALLDKYEGAKLEGMESVATTSGGQMEVEFVGEDHIRGKQRLRNNRSVSLKDEKVGTIDKDDAVAQMAPNIQELDLRNNLLWQWEDVECLGGQLKHLQVLNLGSNIMAPLGVDMAARLTPCFVGLQILSLSATGLPWAEAARAARGMPCLEQLHVCQNNLTVFDGSDARVDVGESKEAFVTGFAQLKVLNLSENGVSSWAEVARFASLPKLQHLLLHHNQLPGVAYESGFASLESIDLNDNLICEWTAADQIAQFPALHSVRLQRNPLVASMGPNVARQLLVARWPNVRRLNQSEVRPRERADAEKGYLRRVAAAFHEAEGVDLFEKFTEARGDTETGTGAGGGAGGGAGAGSGAAAAAAATAGHLVDVEGTRALVESIISPEQFAKLSADHPLFVHLLARHGTEMIAIIKATGSSLSANSATVTLRSMAASSCTVEPVTKKLPLSMTVATLKTLMARLFKCEPELQHLAFRPKGVYPSPLDNDMQTLSFFGVCDGGDILLEEIDPEAVRKAEELAEAERKERLEKQVAGMEARKAAETADVQARKAAATDSAKAQ